MVKLDVHLEREIEGKIRTKRRELKKFWTNETSKQLLNGRFLEHSNLFTFFTDLKNFCDDFSPDILNLVNLLTLASSSVNVSKVSIISTNSDLLSSGSPNLLFSNKINESSNELFTEREVQLTSAAIRNNRYEGKLIALTLSIYLAGISLRIKFLFFQKDVNLFLLLNI